MSDNCSIPHPLKREGTYQWQRLAAGLKKGFYNPDDRTLEQLVKQVAEYASFVKYYDTNLNELGTWESFFDYLYDYDDSKLKIKNIDLMLASGNVPPHLGLMLAFLKTFQQTQKQFNSFTDRHLDFYYSDVLQLKHKEAVADKVALLFVPEKNTVQAKVEEGREMSAGKDGTKKDLVYKTTREIVVNQVAISQKKSVFSDKTTAGKINGIYISKDAAADNKFVQNNITSWSPFGSMKNQLAEIGFAVSSPILLAKEGRRRFSIEITEGASLPRTSLTAYFTGPKGWVEAEVDIVPGVDGSGSTTSKKFLLVKINESLPAIAAYNGKIHKSGFSCQYPIVKFTLKNDIHFPEAYQFFSGIKRTSIKKLVMNVEGAKSFTISSENGKLNPLHAFKPFGSAPVKHKSFFVLGSNEAFNKYLTTFHLAANWKGAHGNMFKYYKAYDDYLLTTQKEKVAGTYKKESYSDFRKPLISFDQGNVPGKMELLSGGKWISVTEDSPNNYTARNANTNNTFHAPNVVKDNFDPMNSAEYSESSRSGFARVTLQYDFGHSIYPAALADTVIRNAKATEANIKPIPGAPYTPEFTSLHLDYVLEDVNKAGNHDLQFMQLHPFGYANMDTNIETLCSADYADNGQLYIGLSGCTVAQMVNLYIARLDGSEDIDAEINEDPGYYYLSGDTWIKYGFEDVVVDTTVAFTSAGFLSLNIPEAALKPNTLMGENLVWIKIVSPTSANAYPSIIDIHTNAVEAVFDNRENDPYHLQSQLAAGTIAKPVNKIDGVKSITQPYASYSGSMAEQDEAFQTRVSERLRHGSRSWSIWDYEHIILDHFPSIYKIKCISHAEKDDMYVPGSVLCVAIPAMVNVSDKDLLEPRLSKAVLTEAENYVAQFKTTFAKVKVINPIYEQITVKCSVQIRKGYDENYYANQLNKDLQQYIAPWVGNKNISPSFEGKIYASGIINFIEELEYIDYLTKFEAFKAEDGKLITWTEYTTGSSEDVILTSAAQHEIDTNAIC